MKAALFDVYGTLLIGSRVTGREAPLRKIVAQHKLSFPPDLSLSQSLDNRISEAHRLSEADYPEIDIREIWQEIFPDLIDADFFALEAEKAVHPVTAEQSAAATILDLHRNGLKLGIISNAQAYTRILLKEHLGPAWDCFDPNLCLYSYEHRIAKPDPFLFQTAIERLSRHGITPSETVMIGDSVENDIEPARRLGMQVKWLKEESELTPESLSGKGMA
ncbi:MAG: HAD family hydrolase [Verrucomicrobiota bacterium]